MPISKRHQDEMKEWEVHKKIIHDLYIGKGMPVREIVDHMAKEHGFHKDRRSYEHRFKIWKYRRNNKNQGSIPGETTRRAEQRRRNQVMGYNSLLTSVPNITARPPPTLHSEYLLNSPESDNQIGMTSRALTPLLRLRTPPAPTIPYYKWPEDLPCFAFDKEFGKKFSILDIARLPTLPSYDFQSKGQGAARAAIEGRDIHNSMDQSIQRIRTSMELVCPEAYEGDHKNSAEILLTGSRESASIVILKFAVHLLSNNMGNELRQLTNGTIQDPVDVLRSLGILTKDSIAWLMNAVDETSSVLKDVLLRNSLETDDSNILRLMLDRGMDVQQVIVHEADRLLPAKPNDRLTKTYGHLEHHVSTSHTLLQAASFYGSNECCQVLLDKGADPNIRANDKGHFPLEYAAISSSSTKTTSLIKLLLRNGADPGRCSEERFGRNLLWLAVCGNHLLLAQKLLRRGAHIRPIIFTVAAQVSREMLSLICKSKKNWVHPKLKSPLIGDMLLPSALCEAKDENLVFLLRLGADPNRPCNDCDSTPLESACSAEDDYTVDALLEYGANPDMKRNTYDRIPALQVAARTGSTPIIQSLLDAGADVNFDHRSPPRTTPLLEALDWMNLEAVELLLQYRPLLLGPELKKAIVFRDVNLLEKLFEAGARLKGNEMSSAVELRDFDIINRLLQEGATVADYRLSLELALLTRNFNEVSTALKHAMYDSHCLFEATSLALKTEQYFFVVEQLVSRRTTMERDALELAALAVAVFNRHSRLCGILCDRKFLRGPWTVDLYDCEDYPNGGIPTIKRDASGIFEIYPWTSRSERTWSSSCPNEETTTFHILDLAGMFDKSYEVDYAVRTFLKLGVCYDSGEFDGLVKHSRISDSPVLAHVIKARAKDNAVMGKDQMFNPSPLVAAVIKMPELVRVLLDEGIDANEKPGFVYPRRENRFKSLPSRTPLQAAVEECNMAVISQLLGSGADVNAPPGCTRGATCLQIAAINGHIGIAGMLLERGARINAPRARIEGRTAIEGAAERGRLDMVKFLLLRLKNDYDPHQHRIQFIRAIMYATKERHNVVANMLKRYIQWNEHDEIVCKSVDIDKAEIIDEMTQELSPFESSSDNWGISIDRNNVSDDDSDTSKDSEDEESTTDYGLDDTHEDSDNEPADNPSEEEPQKQQAADHVISDWNEYINDQNTPMAPTFTTGSVVDEIGNAPQSQQSLDNPDPFWGVESDDMDIDLLG